MRQDSIAEHFGALAELREKGLIRHLGISNVSARHLAEAQAIAPVVCVQNRFGLGSGNPGTDELLRICGEQGIAFVPFFAIAGEGAEQGAISSHDEAVLSIAKAHGAGPAQVRLAWTSPRARTSSPSPALETPTTSPRTSLRARCGSPTPNSPPSTHCITRRVERSPEGGTRGHTTHPPSFMMCRPRISCTPCKACTVCGRTAKKA